MNEAIGGVDAGRAESLDSADVASQAISRQGRSPWPLSPTKRRIPPKLYRISELVAYCGVSRQTIHNYTTMGLLPETQWTDGGHRLYDQAAFRRLDQIAELRSRRKSLGFIREHFAKLDGSA